MIPVIEEQKLTQTTINTWPSSTDAWFKAVLRQQPFPSPHISDEDWLEWLTAVRIHRLSSWLYTSLLSFAEGVRPPDKIMACLKQEYTTAMSLGHQRRQELKQLLQLLEQADIRALVLKGAALSELYYTHPEHRLSADIDLLIEHANYEKAKDILLSAGYAYKKGDRRGQDIWSYDEELRPPANKRFMVDLHWALSPYTPIRRTMPLEPFFETAQGFSWQGTALPTLDLAHAIAYVSAHLIYGHTHGIRLFWLYDVHLLAQQIDSHGIWDDVLKVSVDNCARLALTESLLLASHWFGTILPDKVEQLSCFEPAVEEVDLYNITHSQQTSQMKWHRMRLAGLDNREKLTYWLGRLFPDRREMDLYHPELQRWPYGVALLGRMFLTYTKNK